MIPSEPSAIRRFLSSSAIIAIGMPLPFDMRGGLTAQPARHPLDGRVRRRVHLQTADSSTEPLAFTCELPSFPVLKVTGPDRSWNVVMSVPNWVEATLPTFTASPDVVKHQKSILVALTPLTVYSLTGGIRQLLKLLSGGRGSSVGDKPGRKVRISRVFPSNTVTSHSQMAAVAEAVKAIEEAASTSVRM
jgi:hypothetical protein